MSLEDVRASLVADLRERRKEQRLDGYLYNGSVILTLTCSGVSTILGAVQLSDYSWLPAAFSGAATIFIGIDRALQFGPRWRFHRTIAARILALQRRIETLGLVPEAEQEAEVQSIRQEFVQIPARDPDVPGVPHSTALRGKP